MKGHGALLFGRGRRAGIDDATQRATQNKYMREVIRKRTEQLDRLDRSGRKERDRDRDKDRGRDFDRHSGRSRSGGRDRCIVIFHPGR